MAVAPNHTALWERGVGGGRGVKQAPQRGTRVLRRKPSLQQGASQAPEMGPQVASPPPIDSKPLSETATSHAPRRATLGN